MTGGPAKALFHSFNPSSNARVQTNREIIPAKSYGAPSHVQRQKEMRGNSQAIGGRRRLSQEEINERRNKNLCFGCNEPYSRDHKCLKRQLYSMVVESEDDQGEVGDEVKHYEDEEDVTPRGHSACN